MRVSNSALNLLQKINRTISGKPVSVSEAPGLQFPACTVSGKDVLFRSDALEVSTVEDLVALKGLNYHELAHVLLSPKQPPPEAKDCQAIYQCVEDCRIETQLVAKFPLLVDYFQVTVSRYITEGFRIQLTMTGSKIPADLAIRMLLLLWGRMYLHRPLREWARDSAPLSEADKQAVCAVIEEYVSLTLDEMPTRGAAVLLTLKSLLGKYLPTSAAVSCSSKGGALLRRAEREEIAKELVPDLLRRLSEAEVLGGENEEEDEKEDAEKDEASDEEACQAAVGKSSVGGEAAANDSCSTSEGGLEDSTTGGIGGGVDKEETEEAITSVEDFLDRAETVLAASERHVKRQCQEELNQIKAQSNVTDYTEGFRTLSPTNDMLRVSDRLVHVLEIFRHQQRRGYVHQQRSGSLDLRSAMRSSRSGETRVFRRSINETRSNQPRLAFLVDVSGSMAGDRIRLASRSAWILGRAFRKVNIPVEIWLFNERCRRVVGANVAMREDCYPVFSAQGGTSPYTAIRAAREFLRPSGRRGVMFIVTDGQWDGDRNCEKELSQFEGISIQIAIGSLYKHGCSYELEVNSVDSLLDRICYMTTRIQRQLFLD